MRIMKDNQPLAQVARHTVLVAFFIMLSTPSAFAEWGGKMPKPGVTQASVAGDATLRWLGFRVFDAVLYTPKGAPYSRDEQAALRLRYSRNFSKENLMRSTMQELERLEGARADHAVLQRKLTNCFLDVGKDDSFLAVGISADRVDLYRNADRTCRLEHAGIRARFLDIWLSPNSRFPSLSRRLRGS